jgi:outer membrane protein OmpU
MNNIKKIGLSALAGSLVAMSAQAGDMSVTGTSALYIANSDENTKTGYSMDDSITFSGSTELDNGLTYSFSLELDGDAQSAKVDPAANSATATGSNVVDSHSISISSDSFGTLKFAGHGGAGVLDAWDDVTPNAYEESWDVVSGADASRTNGDTADNSFGYTSPSMSGVTLHASYFLEASTGNKSSYQDYGIMVKPEAVEGLEIGYAFGTTEATAGTEIDDSTMYVKYAYGPVTAAYQTSESDAPTATDTDESTMWGISYAVNDSFSIAYNVSEFDLGSSTTDQESKGYSASYTMGGITVAGAMNSTDNIAGSTDTTADKDAYEMSISFAF